MAKALSVEIESGANVPPRWQFRLWHLFAVTTYVACCAGLARYYGPGTLVTSLGLGVAVLSCAGSFVHWQQGPVQTRLLVVAWLTFIVSLFLPAVMVFNQAYGWEAAWVVLAGPWERIGQGNFHWGLLLFFGDSLANLLQLLLPLLIWRLRRERGQWLAAVLSLAMVSSWVTGWEGGYLVGYYVWCASFALVLVAVRVRRGTLLGMIAVAATLLLIVEGNR